MLTLRNDLDRGRPTSRHDCPNRSQTIATPNTTRVTALIDRSQELLKAATAEVDFDNALLLAFAKSADNSLIQIGPINRTPVVRNQYKPFDPLIPRGRGCHANPRPIASSRSARH